MTFYEYKEQPLGKVRDQYHNGRFTQIGHEMRELQLNADYVPIHLDVGWLNYQYAGLGRMMRDDCPEKLTCINAIYR